uniref:Nuclear receptor coactivator 2-like isoform X4 n=1 Tax=Crassostrea virginica TaxID=6565 RepID=A0A8B8EL73_CRAVI|nr:nuclear receptor coactivator 2-like isoform X4 [Crassostrea virginica]
MLETGKSKCLHERRRRDQENAYFEELAELISASVTDMSALSVKPEKSAILQESLNKIKQLKQEKASSDAVQQSQVSSSKPSVLPTEVLGPLLLEALDGFLFVVNSQGKIEFVSDNVTEYLQYSQDDLIGKSVYNIIHIGDHDQFNYSLLPMSLGSLIPWPSDSAIAKGRTFNCRMLVKPPYDENDDVETKQTYVSQYENLQISAISQPGEKFSDGGEHSEGLSCLVCIARRLSFNEKTNTMLGIEQFTTKQDIHGKIISHDTSGIVRGHYSCPDFTGQNIHDFCHLNDVQTLSKHFQEVLKTKSNTSSVYRFKLQDNRYVFVQTRSQLYENGNNGDHSFIMSTHSIIRECDSDVELKGSASTSLMKSIIGQSGTLVSGNQREQTPARGLPNNISPMAVISAINQPFQNSLSQTIEDLDQFDPSSNNWEFLGDSSFSGNIGLGGSNPVSHNNNNAFSSGNSANLNSWNGMQPQVKMGNAQQQHLSRNVLNMQPQPNSDKQRQLSLNFPRSNSFEGGGQKSPSFTSSPSPRSNQFPPSNSRGMHGAMGYNSQRSPGNSMGQNPRMSPAGAGMNYPMQQRTPPISAVNQNSWGRVHHSGGQFSAPQTPTSSMMSPPTEGHHQGLQNLGGGISPSARRSSEFTFPSTTRPGKLSQLLSGGNPASDLFKSTSLESVQSSTAKDRQSGEGLVTKSPADSMHQSPQPGPGQSPPEKPQSTTNAEDSDKEAQRNVILKQLLSTDDDEEDCNEAAPTEDTRGSENKADMEKNEAEPKKPSNALLKKLLSDDGEKKDGKSRDRSRQTSGDLLQILLNEEESGSSPVIATAESTSHENDPFSRQRHQSGPQEPQSTTPSTSLPQQQQVLPPYSQELHPPATPSSLPYEAGKKSDRMGDKDLNSFLNCLWEKGDNDPIQKPNRKRKASGPDGSVDSTDMELGMPSQQQGKMAANNFRNKNVLLAQLLSKRTPNEAVVNTGRLMVSSDPCETPQNRLSVQDKQLNLRPNDSRRLSVDKEKDSMKDGLQGFQNSSQFGNMDTSIKASVGNYSCTSSMMTTVNTSVFNGISSIPSSNSSMTSLSSDYDELQKFLVGTGMGNSESMRNVISGMDTDPSGTPDPLLAEILKQAADLEQEHIHHTSTSLTSQDMGCLSQGGGSDLNHVASSEDLQLLSQLEQVIQDPSFNITSLPGLDHDPQQSDDRAAIRRIQNQLMSEEPFPPVSSMGQMNSLGPNLSSQAPLSQQQGNYGMAGNQQQLSLSSPIGGGGMDMQYQHMGNQQSPLPTQAGPRFPQGTPKFLPQGPRHSNPQGVSINSALQSAGPQPQRPMGYQSMASQVRQSLLQQQKLKQLRERQAAQQRQLMQRQLGQPFNQRFSPSIENSPMQPFTENLNELLNSGTVPNVTLQRNQIPGPMSPRFSGMQHQQHPNLSQLIRPGPSTPNSSQMSPHFNQQPPQNQWNMRQQQPQQQAMQSPISSNVPKSNQLIMNRHRSFSGGTMTTNNQGAHFQFPDQMVNSGGQMGLLQQQQQQQQSMMAQNRIMRQMSLPPGHASPRAPASPFPNSPDLLMSPRQNPQTSQVSPPFNHASSLASSVLPPSSMATSHPTLMSQQNSVFSDFDLLDSKSMSMQQKSTSQYVKEELRNICNARSEKHLQQQQQQQGMSQGLPPPPASQQTTPSTPQPSTVSEYSELPNYIIEQISEMQQEQQAKSDYNFDNYKEDDVLALKRQEAKEIYKQFRQLSEKNEPVIPDNPEIKASSVFRTQLMTPHANSSQNLPLPDDLARLKPDQVQVVAKEPRGNIEDIKPADHSKNSLLQQLLSE